MITSLLPQQQINQTQQAIIQIQAKHQQQSKQMLLSQLYDAKRKKQIVKQIFPKCIVCKKSGKYKCPKCSVRYCSTQHYRSHNLFCSQSFYQSNVEDHLKTIKAPKQQKAKTLKLIQKYQQQAYQEQGMETMTQERLQQILKNLQENKEIKLTHKQQEQFGKFVNQWVKEDSQKPFWQIQDGLSYLLQRGPDIEIEQFNQSQQKQIIFYRQLLRQKIQKIEPFETFLSKINGKQVSKTIIYQLFYIVYVGCLLHRYFDSQLGLNEFIDYFSKLTNPIWMTKCKSTDKMNSFNSCQQVFCRIESQGMQIDLQLCKWLRQALEDSCKVLNNKYLILEMLFRLLESLSNKELKTKSLKIVIMKKLQFIISYVNSNGFFGNKQIIKQIEEIAAQRNSDL